MKTYSRRSVVAAATTGSLGLFSGCSLLDGSPPAGSLVVQNRHSLPHLVEIEFLDSPKDAIAVRNSPTATVPVEPKSETTYEEVLSSRGTYEIRAKYGNNDPVRFSVNPFSAPNGRVVIVRIERYGNLTYVIDSVDDAPF